MKQRIGISLAAAVVAAAAFAALPEFSLHAQNARGCTLPPQFPCPEPRIVSLEAKPATIKPGGSSEITWATENTGTGRVAISPTVGVVIARGTAKVTPAATTTYTLSVVGGGAPAGLAKTVTVTVEGTIPVAASDVVAAVPTETPRMADGKPRLQGVYSMFGGGGGGGRAGGGGGAARAGGAGVPGGGAPGAPGAPGAQGAQGAGARAGGAGAPAAPGAPGAAGARAGGAGAPGAPGGPGAARAGGPGAAGGQGRGGGGGGPQLKPGLDVAKYRAPAPDPNVVVSECGISSVPVGIGPYNFQIIQSPEYIVILYEYMHLFRVIPVDAVHQPGPSSWMGDSVAHWEGDTLVIETKNFNTKSTVGGGGFGGGFLHSDKLTMVERISRPTYGRLQWDAVLEDPEVFVAPWRTSSGYNFHPEFKKVEEYMCFENLKNYDYLIDADKEIK